MENEFSQEEYWMEKFLRDMTKMQRIHESGHTLFGQSEAWKSQGYGWHNPLLPPEYRRCCLTGKMIQESPAGDLYYLTACYYELITGCRAPCNFELDHTWKEYVLLSCVRWKPEHQKAMIGMIAQSTRWQKEKRIQDAGKLLKTVFSEKFLDGIL